MIFYKDTNIEIEVGDYIKLSNYSRKCKYKDKIYRIDSITNSGLGLWIVDNRTNNKCNCNDCIGISKEGKRCITLIGIILQQKGVEKIREDKIKRLLK